MLSGEMGTPALDARLVRALESVPAGVALDLASGSGRHARWLASLGWRVTAVDIQPVSLPGVNFDRADLERGEFVIAPNAWDLIVCWLYWQANLLVSIARGVRAGGYVALAGKTSGHFATSLANYRAAFPGYTEIDCGEDDRMAWFIARRD